MITLLKTGTYKLSETRGHTKILNLDNETFAWIEPKNIGEILVASRNGYKTNWVLSTGRYRIYDVQDEPRLVDQQHLELETGSDTWQGYLLLTGLPNEEGKRRRIVPTGEVVTHNPLFIGEPGIRSAYRRRASRKPAATAPQPKPKRSPRRGQEINSPHRHS